MVGLRLESYLGKRGVGFEQVYGGAAVVMMDVDMVAEVLVI